MFWHYKLQVDRYMRQLNSWQQRMTAASSGLPVSKAVAALRASVLRRYISDTDPKDGVLPAMDAALMEATRVAAIKGLGKKKRYTVSALHKMLAVGLQAALQHEGSTHAIVSILNEMGLAVLNTDDAIILCVGRLTVQQQIEFITLFLQAARAVLPKQQELHADPVATQAQDDGACNHQPSSSLPTQAAVAMLQAVIRTPAPKGMRGSEDEAAWGSKKRPASAAHSAQIGGMQHTKEAIALEGSVFKELRFHSEHDHGASAPQLCASMSHSA